MASQVFRIGLGKAGDADLLSHLISKALFNAAR
jgi:hypothetical protein